MTIRKYRKKPVEIEAYQWDGTKEEATKIIEWMGDGIYHEAQRVNGQMFPPEIHVVTLEDGALKSARHVASPGDFVIRGVHGEFYPCKPDIFEKTYEVVE